MQENLGIYQGFPVCIHLGGMIMKKKNRIIALFIAGILLLTTGCGKSKEAPAESPVPAETITVAQTAAPVSPETSLDSLRQTMTGTPYLFVVAYFGYHEMQDAFAVMQENAPMLCEDYPFLLEIPEDRIIGESGDLFCIVPLDEDATVAVSKGYWDDENQQNIYDDMLYSSAAGEPILLFCNNAGWEPDTEVYISGPSGEVFWYSQINSLEPACQFLMKPDNPEPIDLIGSWELAWTEVDGYQTDEEQGTRWIEIYTAASGDLLMSYGSEAFPDNDFYNELLMIDLREMYDRCGNREWVADVDYVGPWDTTYTVTLTSEDVLIKQNYFLLDGAPTVSYEYFLRIGECLECGPGEYNEEDPYAYAVSQDWREPELSQLMDTFWLSWSGYALELADDSVPGDNGGWAKLYDVDEIGAYTESYSGYWQYEDGLLYLSLVPAKENGVLVDDSFPVLMLDGELRIGRTSNGTGLPHFLSDTLMDTLQQPKG